MDKRKLRKAVKRISSLPLNRYLLIYLVNKINHYYLRLTRSTRVAFPSTIMIELTNNCNLQCTTCPRQYNYGKVMAKGSMPVENAKRIIDQSWPYLDSIGLTGMGETFLYKEIDEVVDYIRSKNKGIIISVSTNAVLPGFIETVKPLVSKIDTIQISTDGLGNIYENIRRGASFSTLDRNIRLLSGLCRDSGTDIILNMVVTRENFSQMPEMIRYAEETGVRYMDFTLYNLASVTDTDISYYEFYKSAEFLEALKQMDTEAASHKNVTVTGRNFSTQNGFRKCPFPWTHYYISWDGFIPPCCAKPFPLEYNFGNVISEGLKTTLNSNSFRAFRKMWYKNQTPSFCDKCHFIGIEPVQSAPPHSHRS